MDNEEDNDKNRMYYLNIFFCGTGDAMHILSSQIQLFAKSCKGTNITKYYNTINNKNKIVSYGQYEYNDNDINYKENNPNETLTEQFDMLSISNNINNTYKLTYDGCGVVYGKLGILFGYGLELQCREVMRFINEFINVYPNKTLVVNACGFSRGGIACFMLAKMMSVLKQEKLVELNIIAFDPVPGNAIYLSKYDFNNITNTKKSLNLNSCWNLKRLYTIYTHGKINPLILHAPLIPHVNNDITKWICEIVPGWHSQSIGIPSPNADLIDMNVSNQYMTFFLMKQYLSTVGCRWDESILSSVMKYNEYDLYLSLKDRLNNKIFALKASRRRTHFVTIDKCYYIIYNPHGKWLNHYHKKLFIKYDSSIDDSHSSDLSDHVDTDHTTQKITHFINELFKTSFHSFYINNEFKLYIV